jgi:cellulose biosynthesis protein BcsQ
MDVLSGCTHVIAVAQSEMIAQRSSEMLLKGLAAMPGDRRPELLGVVINMFQRLSGPSLEAFQRLCEDHDKHRLFETTIPRSEAFAAASLSGKPLRLADPSAASPVAWLFDMLAAEITRRADIRPAPASAQPSSFLV